MTRWCGVLALSLAALSSAAGPPPYYAGKTITIVTGYAAGGGYSAYAQVFAKHFGHHIPGEPRVVTADMPGAGSIVAANYVSNIAKADGLTLGSVNIFNVLSGYMRNTGAVHFNPSKMNFLGNVRSGDAIFLTRADAYPSLDSIVHAKTPVTLGYAVKGDGHYMFGMAMDLGLGVRFRHVVGYAGGGGDIDLALERGEIDGRVANLNSYLLSKPTWISSGFVKVLAQEGVVGADGVLRRDPRIPSTPTIAELFPNNRKVRELVDYGSVGDLLAGVYMVSPKTDHAVLKTLRSAFMATLADKDFLADAAKFDLEITPMDWKSVRSIVERALETPPELVKSIGEIAR